MFDGIPPAPDLSVPTLEGLSYALRHPEVWPTEYAKRGWHFPDCTRCAMGLAIAMWKDYPINGWYRDGIDIGFLFGLPIPGCTPYENMAPRDIQPHHVADAIDAYLAEATQE